MDAARGVVAIRRSTMTLSSSFVSILALGALAVSSFGCSSSGSGSGESGDYKASDNGCTITMSGAYTGSAACNTFASSDTNAGGGGVIAVTVKDTPEAGWLGNFSIQLNEGLSTGSFTSADGTMTYVMQKSDGTDGFVTQEGTLKLDKADHWGNGQLYECAGSITMDMPPSQGLKSTTALHVVISF